MHDKLTTPEPLPGFGAGEPQPVALPWFAARWPANRIVALRSFRLIAPALYLSLSPVTGATAVPTPLFTIDRAGNSARADLAETIEPHLGNREIVQVVDSNRPDSERLRYTIQWVGGAGHVFDRHGRPLGVFADLDALVEHAETATA